MKMLEHLHLDNVYLNLFRCVLKKDGRKAILLIYAVVIKHHRRISIPHGMDILFSYSYVLLDGSLPHQGNDLGSLYVYPGVVIDTRAYT